MVKTKQNQSDQVTEWIQATKLTPEKIAGTSTAELYQKYVAWNKSLSFPLNKKYNELAFYKFNFYLQTFFGNGPSFNPLPERKVETPKIIEKIVEVEKPVYVEVEKIVEVEKKIVKKKAKEKEKPPEVEIDSELEIVNPHAGKHLIILDEQECFQLIEDYTKAIANRNSNDVFCIISGDSGSGKSTTVKNTLRSILGGESRERFYSNDPISKEDYNKLQWIESPSKIPPKELYCFLYKENGKVILMDDADDLIENSTNINIFKKILDSQRHRKVGYGGKPITLKRAGVNGEDIIIPNSFEFTGKVILITNKYFNQIDPALVSRALVAEVDLPYAETVKRIERLLPYILTDEPKATLRIKNETISYLRNIQSLPKLDIRTTEQAIRERIRSPHNWKRLVERSVFLKHGIKTV